MKTFRRMAALSLVAFFVLASLTGCGGGGTVPPEETIVYYSSLVNPGFEDDNGDLGTNGDNSGWDWYTVVGSTGAVDTVTTPVKSGARALRLRSATSPQSNAVAWQVMAIADGTEPCAGQKVKAEAWIYVDNAVDLNLADFELRLEAGIPGQSNQKLATFTTTGGFAKGEWVHVSTSSIGSGLIPESATSLVIAVENPICPPSGSGAGDIFVDDVKVGAVQN